MNEKLTSWLNHWPRTEVPSPLSSLWNHIASLVSAACIPSAKPFSKPHTWSWETFGFCMHCCHQRAKPWTSSCIHEECDQAKSARFYPLGKVSSAAKMMKSCWALPAPQPGWVCRAAKYSWPLSLWPQEIMRALSGPHPTKPSDSHTGGGTGMHRGTGMARSLVKGRRACGELHISTTTLGV